jgi:hypothetical protein
MPPVWATGPETLVSSAWLFTTVALDRVLMRTCFGM